MNTGEMIHHLRASQSSIQCKSECRHFTGDEATSYVGVQHGHTQCMLPARGPGAHSHHETTSEATFGYKYNSFSLTLTLECDIRDTIYRIAGNIGGH